MLKNSKPVGKLRICVGLTEIAGYCSNLVFGFKALGVEADLLTFEHHPFAYKTPGSRTKLFRLYDYFQEKKNRWNAFSKMAKMITIPYRLMLSLIRIFIFIQSLIKYDVYIFIGGVTFFRGGIDLVILRLLNKTTIWISTGMASRPPYIDGAYLHNEQLKRKLLYYIKKKKKEILFVDRFATYIVDSKPQGLFHEVPFYNILYLGLPSGVKVEDAYKHTPNKVPIILHAPSHKAAKGTLNIEKILSELQAEGLDFKYIRIEKMQNHIVLQHIRNCDFIIDQVYSDTPLAGFATEAAAFGKPAVVGGYYAEMIKTDIAIDITPPSEFVLPENMKVAIKKLLLDSNYRQNLGKQAKLFVETRWAAREVAGRYLQIIKGEAPTLWLSDPNKLNYFFGCGVEKNQIIDIVKYCVDQYSISSLCLSDKPEVEERLLQSYGIRKKP